MTAGPDHNIDNPARALIVEDSAPIRELVTRALTSEGFLVDCAGDLGEARRQLAAVPPDVVVLDVVLPDGNGLDFLREVKQRTNTPVVVLSSRDEELDRVLGLELGADDYVVKPFYPRELAARVRRAARRREARPAALRFGELTIDRSSREVTVGGRTIELTNREFDVLAHLAASPRTVFSRQELLDQVWHSSTDWQSAKTVTEHIRRIRQKIEADPRRPRRIVTVAGAGYRFEP